MLLYALSQPAKQFVVPHPLVSRSLNMLPPLPGILLPVFYLDFPFPPGLHLLPEVRGLLYTSIVLYAHLLTIIITIITSPFRL